MARLLLKKSAKVEARDCFSLTPLSLAAGRGHMEVVKLLLKRGVDANVEDMRGWTLPLRAARNGHKEVAKLIMMESLFGRATAAEISNAVLQVLMEQLGKVFLQYQQNS